MLSINPPRKDRSQGMKKQKKKVYVVLQFLISNYQSVSEVGMPAEGIYCHHLHPLVRCLLSLITLHLSAEQG